MRINSAALSELSVVKNICEATISAIYPKYYPAGAVRYFLELHSENNILKDIGEDCVYLYKDALEIPVGTVTVKGNEVCRLFVLPAYQVKGMVLSFLILRRTLSCGIIRMLLWRRHSLPNVFI